MSEPSARDPDSREVLSAQEAQGASRAVSPALHADPVSAMAPRFNLLVRAFARRFFSHFELDEATVRRLKELEQRGTVVYVMRYSSRLDYFLFNTVFLRAGLRLSSFANGIRFHAYGPLFEWVRTSWRRQRGQPHELEREAALARVRELTGGGASFFLFLRTARFRNWLRGRRARHDEVDLLHETIRAVWEADKPVFVVPLSLFWRKGPRSETRFLNLNYGSLTRPSDLAKVTSFLATYRSLAIKTGEPIDLGRFVEEHRSEGPARVTRKVRRAILIYLYREEKIVEGPTLRSPARVLADVLADPGVQASIAERAMGKRSSPERARADAEKIFREIAARMNSTLLALMAAAVRAIFRRMFSSIEVTGLELVTETAKRQPIVLVPSHRSYFDFLIVSYLLYQNFIVPPHIAARENMAFGPFGFVARRCGAFFLRASFDDPLYKEVFRAYLAHLVKEGFTQEFFIEGGRSRTGKSLAPRLGMLTWNVDAFLDSTRHDFLFVPVSVVYERLVEESVMVGELEGAEKARESTWGLVRARKYLQRRFGSVHLTFDTPLSLREELGERRERFAESRLAALEAGERERTRIEKREFIEALGRQIVERINAAAFANATSVAATVLLGATHRGLMRTELVTRMQQVVELLRLQGVRLTSAVVADLGDFNESISFLTRADLVQSVDDTRGEILFYEESRRRALDIYRNSIAHFLATPSCLARSLLRGATEKELREDLDAWQEILYREFFTPRGAPLDAQCGLLLEHFEQAGHARRDGNRWEATESGTPLLFCLSEQTRGVIEAYQAVCSVLADLGGGVPTRDESGADDLAWIDTKEIRKRAAGWFLNAELLGETARPEAANDTTFSNVLALLVERRILASERLPGRRAETRYARGESFSALDELRERLAAALASG